MLPDAHKWEIVEVFSTPDGSVQFIEWFNTDPDENLLSHESLSTASGSAYSFPNDLSSPNTANRRFLMATSAFAALPGAPTPDYIMPAGTLSATGDTIDYSGGDVVSFGALPNDGVTSIDRNGAQQVNSPQNFAGATGTIDAAPSSATFTTFGAGCPHGINGETMTVSANPPVLGTNFTVTFNDAPSPFVSVILGLSTEIGLGVVGQPNLPFDLSGFGLTGCSLLVSADLASEFVFPPVWVLPIPNLPEFTGLPLNVQGLSEAQGANPLGIIISNAGKGIVGN